MKQSHLGTILFSVFLAHASVKAADTSTETIAPIKAPFDMPQLTRPKFPDHVVNIRDHGAVEGGTTKNTDAFKKAIEACAKLGGGRVLVPAGKWLTGPIHFKSNIDLHLEEGAEIIFSDVPEDYLPPVFVRSGGIEMYNYSPLLYAKDCENVAITGPGKLNGNGEAWWDWKTKETGKASEMSARGEPVEKRVFGTREAAIRPNFIVFVNCKNVLLEGFTITSGPMWTIHPIYCENIIIRRVHLDTHGPNNDGIDPDSCKNLLVEYCTFTTGDDCMVLKSGYNEDGWRVNKPTENVVMRNCTGKEGHGGLVIGSEMSGGVRNVLMRDCEFDGTDHAVRIKSRIDRGGFVENVWAENVKAKNLKRDVVIITMDYGSDRKEVVNRKPPLFRNFHIKDIVADDAPAAIIITGAPDSPVQNVSFENMTISSKKGVTAKELKDITFKNVQITSPKGPIYDLTNASQVTIQGAKAPNGLASFLELKGDKSSGILIQASDLSGAKQPFVVSAGAPANAVSVKQ